jgi:hypothetical protein
VFWVRDQPHESIHDPAGKISSIRTAPSGGAESISTEIRLMMTAAISHSFPVVRIPTIFPNSHADKALRLPSLVEIPL